MYNVSEHNKYTFTDIISYYYDECTRRFIRHSTYIIEVDISIIIYLHRQ